MNKKGTASASKNTILKLRVLAKKKEGARRKLAVVAGVRRLRAKNLAATAKEKEGIRSKLEVAAKRLAAIAKEKESVRHRLVVVAKKLAVIANEKEIVRSKLLVTAKNLAATAKEKESIKRRLAVTAETLRLKAEQLVVTAKEKEDVRRRLVVVAGNLAATARGGEGIRRRLEIAAETLRLKAEQLVITAKDKEDVRRKLEVTAKNLAATAKEKENIRRKLAVTAKELEKSYATLERSNLELKEKTLEAEDAKRALLNILDDLKNEKKNLAKAKAKDEAILASIGDGLVATDKEGKIILVNSVFEKMLGWTEVEVMGRSLSEIVRASDQSNKEIPESERLITMTLKRQITTTTAITTNFKRRDGVFFPVALTVAPIVIDSELIGAVEVFRDITKEKELDRVKSEFISIASHQLRTPLTGIQWVVERFTKKEELTPKGREYLNDIHMSAKRLTEMVDLLLNLSRIEAGRVGITPETLEAIDFVKKFLDETIPLQDKKQIKIVFDDHPEKLIIETDRSALHNIVQSLVSNAIEYTPDGGGIRVVIQKKNDTFLIKVQDTGIGIPRTEQTHIFEKFMRASNAKLYKTDGTGIGLYIAERATSLLGGKIWFESEEGKGSTFYVELPLKSQSQKNRSRVFVFGG